MVYAQQGLAWLVAMSSSLPHLPVPSSTDMPTAPPRSSKLLSTPGCVVHLPLSPGQTQGWSSAVQTSISAHLGALLPPPITDQSLHCCPPTGDQQQRSVWVTGVALIVCTGQRLLESHVSSHPGEDPLCGGHLSGTLAGKESGAGMQGRDRAGPQ